MPTTSLHFRPLRVILTLNFVKFEAAYVCKSLREKVQIRTFFWYVFSCIRTEYGDLWSKCPYSVRIQENMDKINSVFGHFSRSN